MKTLILTAIFALLTSNAQAACVEHCIARNSVSGQCIEYAPDICSNNSGHGGWGGWGNNGPVSCSPQCVARNSVNGSCVEYGPDYCTGGGQSNGGGGQSGGGQGGGGGGGDVETQPTKWFEEPDWATPGTSVDVSDGICVPLDPEDTFVSYRSFCYFNAPIGGAYARAPQPKRTYVSGSTPVGFSLLVAEDDREFLDLNAPLKIDVRRGVIHGNFAMFEVHNPATSHVSFDGQELPIHSGFRATYSAELVPRNQYTYNVKYVVGLGPNARTLTQQVAYSAGDRLTIQLVNDWSASAPGSTQPTVPTSGSCSCDEAKAIGDTGYFVSSYTRANGSFSSSAPQHTPADAHAACEHDRALDTQCR